MKDAAFEAALAEFGEEALTAFSHDVEVGVKWKVQRGWRVSHSRTLGCLWTAYLSRIACTSFPADTCASMALRKRMNSSCLWHCMQRPMMWPFSTFSAANRVVVPLRR